jgi:glycosyltransferase involved in cell wall biosynthesis
MRVGIDTNGLRTTQAGVARYIRGLLSGLVALDVADLEVEPLAWEVDNLSYRQPQRSLKTLYREGVWAPLLAPRRMRASKLDVFHATSGPMARVPVGMSKVATAHDMAVFRYPGRYRAWQRMSGPRRLAALAGYDRVISISQFTADEMIECLGVPASLIEVVHNGCDFSPDVIPPERPPDFELPPDFFLFVGSLEPVKNLRLLRQAYESASARGITLPALVIVGARWLGVEGEGSPPPGWLYAGRLDDDVLVHLYRRALALLFPTMYEGFGFPLVEAMALGCPVICSPLASLPELGGDAPIYADQTPAAYLEAMLAVAGDPARRDDQIAAGRERARRFDWRRCADETLAVYRDVARG